MILRFAIKETIGDFVHAYVWCGEPGQMVRGSRICLTRGEWEGLRGLHRIKALARNVELEVEDFAVQGHPSNLRDYAPAEIDALHGAALRMNP